MEVPAVEVPVGYFAAALAWAAIWVNFVVIPFFSRSETLFKDLIDGGARDRSLAFIESEKLLPALAELIDKVIEIREARETQHLGVHSLELLENLDFETYLQRAQVALGEKRAIESRIEELMALPSFLWKIGLFHAVTVIAIPASLLLKDELHQAYVLTAVVSLAALSLVLALICLVRYDRRRSALHRALKDNRKNNAG